jgi:hypothetical protein
MNYEFVLVMLAFCLRFIYLTFITGMYERNIHK